MTRVEYTANNRPLSNQILCHQLSVGLALKCLPDNFDTTLLVKILGHYFKLTKKTNKPKQECLSDKQFSILYHIYVSYRVKDVFMFDKLKFACVCRVEFDTLVVFSKSNLKMEEDFYFETKDDGILTTAEFIELYPCYITHPNYVKTLKETAEEDFC
jgi:hypothetical protein